MRSGFLKSTVCRACLGGWGIIQMEKEVLKMEGQDKKYQNLIRRYIRENIGSALKEPRSFIRYPFIDPGSVYDGNVWDWDSYWCVYGLLGMMGDFPGELRDKILLHAKGNVGNFLDHQLEDGYIPMMIEVGEWMEPYLNMRHKEHVQMNMHKPFLCAQIVLISDYCGSYEWIADKVEQIKRYLHYYRNTYFMEEKGLYVWCDDIMIGMDNDPASFGRPKFSTANIFLNSFMVHELECAEKIMKMCGREGSCYAEHRKTLVRAVQEECWDLRDEIFYSVDVDIKTRKYDWFHQGFDVFWKTLPIKIQVWSAFIPLWAGFATKEQAAALAAHYRDEKTFHSEYGITSLAKDEKMFNLDATNNPSNWLGAIWLVANYVVFRGLLNYGYKDEAEEICRGSLKLLGKDLEKTGCLHECYNPFNGEPIMNGGFINWNILALNMAAELEMADKQGANS